jgi:hypothetical protein
MATEAQTKAVQIAKQQILDALKILDAEGIEEASFQQQGCHIRLQLQKQPTWIRFRLDIIGTPVEDDSPPTKNEKLPGMTPSRAPERPIDIDKGDLS